MTTCKICGSSRVTRILHLDRVPVLCNRLFDTREEALGADTARIDLRFCRDCMHTFNAAFDPERVAYSPGYENALEFSPRFQRYADELATRLAARYNLHDKDVVEVGCGRGTFLASLCLIGENRGLGYDPSFPDGVQLPRDVKVKRAPYSDEARDVPADFLVCRQCLEHMDDPIAFLRMVRRNLAGERDTGVFFEVPSFLFTLRGAGVWDVIYEHAGYFTPSSLSRALDVAGFHVTEVAASFGDQYLTAHALAPRSDQPRLAPARPLHAENEGTVWEPARLLGLHYHRVVEYWRARLDGLHRQRRRVVVWGAGSKGTTFLNAVHPHGAVETVVDISPLKGGRFVPVTGQRIARPEELRSRPPDLVLLMNPIYRDEVAATLDALGLNTTILQVVSHGPEETEGQHRATGS